MARYYEVEIRVHHVVSVWADNDEMAEEIAYDAFIDDEGYWEDVDVNIIYSDEGDDE